MNINPNLFISFLISIVLFLLGFACAKKMTGKKVLILILSFILILPGTSMILYYFHLFNTPVWYINFRAIPSIEILISFFGLILGLLAKDKNKYVLMIVCRKE
jgi:hypothetical protein